MAAVSRVDGEGRGRLGRLAIGAVVAHEKRGYSFFSRFFSCLRFENKKKKKQTKKHSLVCSFHVSYGRHKSAQPTPTEKQLSNEYNLMYKIYNKTKIQLFTICIWFFSLQFLFSSIATIPLWNRASIGFELLHIGTRVMPRAIGPRRLRAGRNHRYMGFSSQPKPCHHQTDQSFVNRGTTHQIWINVLHECGTIKFYVKFE